MKPLALARVRSALVVAPHPDDEVIGAYGMIRKLRALGARVRVIVVTDGTGSHPGSVRWPAPRLAAWRQRETLAALRGLVGKADVTFLGLPDGGLSDMPSGRLAPLRRAIAVARACDLLLLPARSDDHPDHRVVARIASSASGIRRRFEYLVWPDRTARSHPTTHALRLGVLAAAKRGAIRRYRSQTGAITDDPGGFTISQKELAAFSHPLERFRAVAR